MRSLLFAIAAIFILGGAFAIINPRTLLVTHLVSRRKTGIEVISKDESVLYGALSLGFGALALYAGLSCQREQEGTKN